MLSFIDLFSGIGGFHIALSNLGAKCVLAAEINEQARKTYEENFKPTFPFHKDITTLESKDIPDFDILCAGFPCQPFSNIGLKKGFVDTRGTLFFEIERIIRDKQPKAFILENVRGLLGHDNGNTLSTIKKAIKDLNYSFYCEILYAKDYNVPQSRPRLYMVGFRDPTITFKFPDKIPLTKTMSTIFGKPCSVDVGNTIRVGGRSSPIGDRHTWDAYFVDGKWVRLTSEEAKEMQGFPKTFTFPVSEAQAMKQLGNAVAVPVVEAVFNKIKNLI